MNNIELESLQKRVDELLKQLNGYFSEIAVAYKPHITDKPKPKAKPKILYSEEISNDNFKLAESYGFKPASIMYGWSLDRNDDAVWDGSAQIEEWAQYSNTSRGYDGYICLDWEGRALERLESGDPKVMDEFLKALRFMKAHYPKAKVGFYGIPKVSYWGINGPISDSNSANLDRANQVYRPLLDECTAWFPSIYQYYPVEEVPQNKEVNYEYIRWNVKNVLKLRGDRQIDTYVFVWPRFHECCTRQVNFEIPKDRFKIEIATILNTEYNGNRVDGIWWWGADQSKMRDALRYNVKPLWLTQYSDNPAKWPAALDNFAKENIKTFREILKVSASEKSTAD